MIMDHVSLTVRDVGRSIEFYSKALGLKLLRASVLHPQSGSRLLELGRIVCEDHAPRSASTRSRRVGEVIEGCWRTDDRRAIRGG